MIFEKNPSKIVNWGFQRNFVVSGSLLPIFHRHSKHDGTVLNFVISDVYFLNFDLFGDEAQYWLWSKNIDFGYYSKPPLLPWIISLVCWVFGNSIFVIKMIAILLYGMTSFVIYLISKKLI